MAALPSMCAHKAFRCRHFVAGVIVCISPDFLIVTLPLNKKPSWLMRAFYKMVEAAGIEPEEFII